MQHRVPFHWKSKSRLDIEGLYIMLLNSSFDIYLEHEAKKMLISYDD